MSFQWSKYTLATLLLLVFTIGKAQSLFEDSRVLGGLLAKGDSLFIRLDFSAKNFSIFLDGKDQNPAQNPFLLLKKTGTYICSPNPNAKNDTIHLWKGNKRIKLLPEHGEFKIIYNGLRAEVDYPAISPKDSILSADTLIWKAIIKLVQDTTQGKIDPTKLASLRNNPYLGLLLKEWIDNESAMKSALAAFGFKKTAALNSIALQRKLKANSVTDQFQRNNPESLTDAIDAQALLKQNSAKMTANTATFQLDENAVLRELSAFIEKRAQEEINLLFLNRLNQQLDKSDLGTLFPETRKIFGRFELSSYKSALAQALPAFKKDMEQVGVNFAEFISRKNNLQYDPAVYNTAFLIGLIQQTLQRKNLDSLLVFTYNSYLQQGKILSQAKEVELAKKKGDLKKLYENLQSIADTVKTLKSNARRTLLGLQTYGQTKLTFDAKSDPQGNLKQQYDELNKQMLNGINNLDPAQPYDDNAQITELSKIKNWLNGLPDPTRRFSLDDYDKFMQGDKADSILLAQLTFRRALNWQDTLFYEELDQALQVSQDVLPQLTEIAAELERNRSQEELERVLSIYRTHWLLRKGLELQQASAINPLSEADRAVGFFYSTILDPTVSKNLVESIEKDFFEKTGAASPNDKVFERITALNEYNQKLKHLLAQHWREIKKQNTTNKFPPVTGYLNQFNTLADLYRQKNQMIRAGQELDDQIDKIKSLIKDKIKGAIADPPTEMKNTFLREVIDSLPQEDKPEIKQIKVELLNLEGSRRHVEAARQNLAAAVDLTQGESYKKASLNAQYLSGLARLGIDIMDDFSYYGPTDTVELRPALKNTDFIKPLKKDGQEKYVVYSRKWLGRDSLFFILDDPYRKSAFLGGLHHQISNNTNLPLRNAGLENLAIQIVDIFYELEKYRSNIQKKEDSARLKPIRLEFRDYLPLIQSCLRLFKELASIELKNEQTLGSAWKLSSIFNVFDEALNLYDNLDQKAYLQALGNTIGLFQLMSDKKESSKDYNKFQFNISKYGNFLAEMAKANSQEQIQNLLRAYAAPPGSSQIKRLNDQNWSINAYLGASSVLEFRDNSTVGKVSLSSPLGVAYSFRTGPSTGNYRQSWTVLASILDVGPIVSYDFTQGKKEEADKLVFADFFTPGVFVFKNINRSPFTFGLGWQRFQNIRTNLTEDNLITGSRLSLSFLIDVPLISLWSKKK